MDVVDGEETVIVVEDEITVDVDNVAAAVMTVDAVESSGAGKIVYKQAQGAR